jgi:hypothetical protein
MLRPAHLKQHRKGLSEATKAPFLIHSVFSIAAGSGRREASTTMSAPSTQAQ